MGGGELTSGIRRRGRRGRSDRSSIPSGALRETSACSGRQSWQLLVTELGAHLSAFHTVSLIRDNFLTALQIVGVLLAVPKSPWGLGTRPQVTEPGTKTDPGRLK